MFYYIHNQLDCPSPPCHLLEEEKDLGVIHIPQLPYLLYNSE